MAGEAMLDWAYVIGRYEMICTAAMSRCWQELGSRPHFRLYPLLVNTAL